jgi:hypothetical protein
MGASLASPARIRPMKLHAGNGVSVGRSQSIAVRGVAAPCVLRWQHPATPLDRALFRSECGLVTVESIEGVEVRNRSWAAQQTRTLEKAVAWSR